MHKQTATEIAFNKGIDEYGRDLAGRYGTGPRIPVDQREHSRKVPGETKAQRRMRRRAAR